MDSLTEPAAPAAADLTGRIAAIAANARERAERTERDRRVPAATLDELAAAGLFEIVQPRAHGGAERGFDELVEHVLTLSAACASTGWVAGLFAAHRWLLAGFQEQAQRDVLDADPGARICGSYAPAGAARLDGDGYRINGRWSFASGADAATWAVCACFLPTPQGIRGAPAFFLVPAADYTVHDDWHVTGLAGTGSKTLVLDDVFVPAHRLLPLADSMAGTTPGAALRPDSAGLRIPMLCHIPSCLAAVAVGAAAGALDDFLRTAGARETRGALAGGGSRLAGFATVQLRVAEASAAVDAAREILLRDLRRRAATSRDGATVTEDDRILSRRGQAYAVAQAVRAVEAVNGATGGQGLALANPVQRAWRDVTAVSRHISLNWDAVGTMVGQSALGLPPQGQY
ncbi:acyl-CoA dehydrogenase family protein [Actinomadura parmotrematis]|uniref:Acyl-CoA dehydrogenase family protein n=1 Tax=Actinomadura parmotrematis TaxID=2864039 RepID=A0ABS7G410_9ACTN|nr:acyl-CoA dehydrogenase family protein [Actinomadura parmotrematis]MBW8487211.1 acyl-CoA dehydrogenase family protein [Actinomadura parmotrematis]